jgi:hypothetical protein
MKNKIMKVYIALHPATCTEWISIQGDKYRHALPFAWEIVDDLKLADVLVWDGVISPKSENLPEIVDDLVNKGKVLLLQGEAVTLMKEHPWVKLFYSEKVEFFSLPGWSVLPEELLGVLEKCYKKLPYA